MDDLFSDKPATGLSGARLKEYLDSNAQVSIEKTWIAAWGAALEHAASICDGMADRIAAGEEWTPLGAVEECADQIEEADGQSQLTAELGTDLIIPDFLRNQRNLAAEKDAEIKWLRDALHQISLCSKNSASSQNECGRIARAALVPNAGLAGTTTEDTK